MYNKNHCRLLFWRLQWNKMVPLWHLFWKCIFKHLTFSLHCKKSDIFLNILKYFLFLCLLGDQEMIGGCYYWELCPLADWKSFSVGVAYRASLGRFDQLGKSTGSWCLHASQWLQSSLAAKHNNRAKALDWPLPQRIGIYCDYDNGVGKIFYLNFSDSLCSYFSFKSDFLMLRFYLEFIFIFFNFTKTSTVCRWHSLVSHWFFTVFLSCKDF